MLNCAGKPDLPVIAYPQLRPDSVALPFLPGVVSSDSLDFNLAFSPDGKTIYFCRSKHGKWLILQSRYEGEAWSLPLPAPFSEPGYSQADPFVTTDGSVYYISDRPRDESDSVADFNIWFVKPTGEHTWSKPVWVDGINSDSTEYYVSLAANGNLYFASNRAGGFGGLDLYVSEFIHGKYASPKNLGAGINSATDEHDPLTFGEEEFVVFTSSGRSDTYGEADLYYAQKKSTGTWDMAKNMGPGFNTATYEYCPNLSPDKAYFFFSSEYDVKWISVKKLPFDSPE